MVFLSLIFTLAVGAYGYFYFEGQKKKMAEQEEKIKSLSESEAKLKSDLSDAAAKEQKLSEDNALLAEQTKKFENEKSVILNQVRTSVSSFETFRTESRNEIDKLKQSVDDLEAERTKLTDELNSVQSLTKKEKEDLTSQVKSLNDQISEHKRQEDELVKSIRVKERSVMVSETAKLHYNLGNYYFKNRQYKSAAAEYRQALIYNDDDADIHFNLATVSDEYLGDYDTAITEYKRYLELKPKAADYTKIKLRLADIQMEKQVLVAKDNIPNLPKFKNTDSLPGSGGNPAATNVVSGNKKQR